jgi:hypothetical protein
VQGPHGWRDLVGAAGMVAAAMTRWTRGCDAPLDERARRVRLAADALLALASLTGAVNLVCGVVLTRSARDGAVPIERGLRPSRRMRSHQRRLHQTMVAGGWTQLTALAGALALEPVL